MSNSFKDWLESLQNDLYDMVKKSRRHPSYIDRTICDKKSFYIWKKSGRDAVEKDGNTTIIKLAPLKTISVSPTLICLRLLGNWRGWYEQGSIMGVWLGGICRNVARKEERIVVETLMQSAKNFTVRSETFTFNSLKDATNYIATCGNFADILLVNPLQITKLRDVKEFIPYWNLGQEHTEKMGSGFIGYLSQFSVFTTTGLSESTGLIYEKRMAKVRKTPLSIKFDDYNNPKMLIIEEKMFAWTMDDEALAKITLNTSPTPKKLSS